MTSIYDYEITYRAGTNIVARKYACEFNIAAACKKAYSMTPLPVHNVDTINIRKMKSWELPNER